MGELSHKAARLKQKYSSDPKNFAYAQTKVWDELSPLEKASSMFQEYTSKGAALAKEVGSGMKTAATEAIVTGADIKERLSPTEFGANINAGIKEVITGDKNVPASIRFQKGRAERQARPLMMERLTGQQLKNEDGTVNWDFARKFVGRAMEIPTYGYAGAVQGSSLVGKGLLTRLLTRTARSVPEAGVNTAIQTFEEGSTENWKTNMLANTLLMSGVSNIAGEIKFPTEVLNKTIGDIEGQVGKLTPEQKLDVQDALRQGVKSEDILTNLQKVVKNEVTPDEVAAKVNAAVESPKVETPEAKVETPDDPLLQEARKYKSAEEFTNSSPSYYHVTDSANASSIEKGGFTGKVGERSMASKGDMQGGTFLYPEKESAGGFSKNFKNPATIETKVNGKIYDANRETKYGWEDNLQTQEIASDPKILAQLKKDGYVGVTSTELGTPATFVFDPSAIKTKSQLTDIWKKAQGETPKLESTPIIKETETPKEVKVPQSQMPVGTGKEKVSRLEARMTGNLGKLTPEQIDTIGLATYKQMNKADQIKAAAEYVTANPDNVIKILSGEMEPPKGLLKNSIYVAAENLAHDDAGLARKLASLQSTRLGQELSILTEALEDSPVKAMREVSDARIQATEKHLKSGSVSKTRTEITKKAKESVDKTVAKAIKEDWNSFVDAIKCNS